LPASTTFLLPFAAEVTVLRGSLCVTVAS